VLILTQFIQIFVNIFRDVLPENYKITNWSYAKKRKKNLILASSWRIPLIFLPKICEKRIRS